MTSPSGPAEHRSYPRQDLVTHVSREPRWRTDDVPGRIRLAHLGRGETIWLGVAAPLQPAPAGQRVVAAVLGRAAQRLKAVVKRGGHKSPNNPVAGGEQGVLGRGLAPRQSGRRSAPALACRGV